MSNNQKTTSGNTAPTAADAAYAVSKFLMERMASLKILAGGETQAKRLIAVAVKAVQNKPELLGADRQSLYNAVRLCAELRLEPNHLGHAHFVPFKGKVQFLLGYRGMIELANRAGIRMDAHPVYSNDKFSFKYGLNTSLEHTPALDDRGEFVGAYAVAWPSNGQPTFRVLGKQEIENRRMRGGAASAASSPWNSDLDAMACKTAVRALFSFLPMTDAMMRAQEIDDNPDGVADLPELDGNNAAPTLPAANGGRSRIMESLDAANARNARKAGAIPPESSEMDAATSTEASDAQENG